MASGGSSSAKVAVVGAGPCGLVAARELRSEGLQAVVFEKGDRLGGTWVYDPSIENLQLSVSFEQGRQGEEEEGVGVHVHSSIYHSLRTNVPRQIMGFLDYPFLKEGHGGDSRTFPRREEVLSYLDDFARDFQLVELIRFRTEVVRVERNHGSPNEWIVQSRSSCTRTNTSESESKSKSEELFTELFDAVVICNGHTTEPRFAEIPGIDKWTGKQIHSHHYRIPEPFRDQIVVLIGNGPSAHDISREISEVSKEVHLASRSPNVKIGKLDNHCNIWNHSMVAFQDGSSVFADTIFHCTGYKYNFAFLETNGIVTVDDNRVGPLYKHVFPPCLAPWLSFVGLPTMIVPFMTYGLQANWVAKVLSGKVLLPSEQEMMNSVEELYRYMEATGRPKHYTHKFDKDQSKYRNWLAAQVGLPPIDDWVDQMAAVIYKFLTSDLDGYRDNFNGDYWIQQFKSSSERKD
ncbi:flavin-containing monooxygenase FMO GS-OX5-like isoform X2 [Macadamia integrifolia]|uniref:flavin-containing monooxygenase FMO GS-OX5-like isoform X2 n=1 Tax=Macadamia integrifolia TaxID=60698 RepID=UPI001C4F0134|nr:flavin-containing monooxygenase FMO GS-OX5-like isoform X2 [Macadamia integrifolia]